ncbi:methylmalonyl-CoA mutase family protein [Oceanibacterium hippocampi]|uniref:Methylmalonyl-CoA mutase small subunit n=1 Tax=Oceanibacterium hippocampi TaxID=745714 RepID=A0A1Y5TZU2_9PROT|nr:methylmalonyl-CoA mutase family protein [Oceanibacterium hippocampi]SLN77690.1 Methylmalonyl-CoA mutase small subunit [Oceanibacterium hippocampi]
MTDQDLVLAGDFPAVDDAAWRGLVDKALKGASFEKRLVTRSLDGIEIRPLYTRDKDAPRDRSGFPGAAPFTRGSDAAGATRWGWEIRQRFAHPEPAESNREIRRDLSGGVNSVLLRFDRAARNGLDGDRDEARELAGQGGAMAYGLDDFERIFDGVALDAISVALEAGGAFLPAAGLLTALWARRGLADGDAHGAFNADPLGTLASDGELPGTLESQLRALADLAAACSERFPGVTAVAASAVPYHDAGASEAEELAATMATGVEYLRAMTGAGLGIDEAARQIAFTIPLDADFFLSIAKLRAARKLWSRIAGASGAGESAQAARIHAETSWRMLSRRDPWVNLLRNTGAAFAAGVGGAESVTVRPHTDALGLPAELARRIARNMQAVLMEESSLHRVMDPAGGSWFVEDMTDRLAAAAWSRFQAIEAAGGMAKVVLDGSLARDIAKTADRRARRIAHREEPITGVSEYPQLEETAPEILRPDLSRLASELHGRLPDMKAREAAAAALDVRGDGLLAATATAAEKGATVGALSAALFTGRQTAPVFTRHRLAEGFEALRDRADAHAEAGARPTVFLATLGHQADFAARAGFARNFFAAGGIAAVDGGELADGNAAAKAFRESGARVAVLCSSDALYGEKAEDTARALKTAGCDALYLAGRAGDNEAAYRAAGIDEFVFAGCDALALLDAALTRMGVDQ